jgi:phosphoglycolate phosphatase-like HAD superfamily hydrolase
MTSLRENTNCEARKVVLQELRAALNVNAANESIFNDTSLFNKWLYLFTPACICVTLYLIAIGITDNQNLYGGRIFTVIVILFVSVANYLLLSRIHISEKIELKRELSKIHDDYSDYLDTYTNFEDTKTDQSHDIGSGNAHVNLVSTFRNYRWQRIPVLLLAKGDIISLMAGDITPGVVREMAVIANTSDNDYFKSNDDSIIKNKLGCFKLGPIIQKGVKIMTSHFNQQQQQQQRKHRSLSSYSPELLSLSGEIRCFYLNETPIAHYVQNLFNEENARYKYGRGGTETYFDYFGDSQSFSIEKRDKLNKIGEESVLRTLFQIALRNGVILSSILFVLYCVCTIIRFVLLESAREQWIEAFLVPVATIVLCLMPISLPLSLMFIESFAIAKLLSSTEVILEGHSIASDPAVLEPNGLKSGVVRGRHNSMSESLGVPSSVDDHTSVDDEFLDEDIDDRAEEIAEEASARITFSRLMAYFFKVIKSRLSIDYYTRSGNTDMLLSIPLARTRILEMLGAVTMVCFIDDDIICEPFSITEEIFFFDENQTKDIGTAPGIAKHYTLLDLHAVPHTTGSRFENPLWWQYLSVLKPIGLASALTYSSIKPLPLSLKYFLDNETSRDETSKESREHKKASKKSHLFNGVESSLITHVRETMPLSALKELAECIGFEDIDVEIFTKMFEMNVMAPGLGDVKLLLDMHAWGQEETRRRGTLFPHVRASIVNDSRSNSFQLMSQGDPSLLLNYCRECWDGSSISPLSAADRKEVLNVYNRWDLEDFDVVAFSYTPIPTTLHSIIVNAHTASGANLDNITSKLEKQLAQPNCVFIVDPSTYQELEEQEISTIKKHDSNRPEDKSGSTKAPVASVENSVRNNEEIVTSNVYKGSEMDFSAAAQSEPANVEVTVDEISLTGFADPDSLSIKRSRSDSDLFLNQTGNAGSAVSGNVGTPVKSILMSSNEASDPKMGDGLETELIDITSYDDFFAHNIGAMNPSLSNNEEIINEMDEIDNDEQVSLSIAQRNNSRASYSGDAAGAVESSASADLNSVNIISKLSSEVEEETSNISIDDVVSAFDKGGNENVRTFVSVNTTGDTSKSIVLVRSRSLDTVQYSSLDNYADEEDVYSGINATLVGGAVEAETDTGTKLLYNKVNRETVNEYAKNGYKSKQIKRARSVEASIWPCMRQQIFLGMAASSVAIKKEVPDLVEHLTKAGIRFIYFSPRNMRRSKPVAEKIGLQFDWNCAISLRDLDGASEHDPHRYISQYADWDVHAKLPHGVDAIKKHLKEVDNVPLLVSLYTDATPQTIHQMVQVFRGYGEVVLTVGSSYRALNQPIFAASDVPIAVAMLPGNSPSDRLSTHVDNTFLNYPNRSIASISKFDLLFYFKLIGLGCLPLIQIPSTATLHDVTSTCLNIDTSNPNAHGNLLSVDMFPGPSTVELPSELRLSSLLEAIRFGRIFLLNVLQALAFSCISFLSLGMWPLMSQAVPMDIPPSLPPSLAILFILVHVPLIAIAIAFSDGPDKVAMKNAPRKSMLTRKPGDEKRFMQYLAIRCSCVCVSVFLIGLISLAATSQSDYTGSPWYAGQKSFSVIDINNSNGISKFWLIQDLMSCEMLLSLIAQSFTLLERGQSLDKIPTFSSHLYYYLVLFLVSGIHVVVMVVRGYMRDNLSIFMHLGWLFWAMLVILPLLQIVVGIVVNKHDNYYYARYLQYLKLEYDTRLGMHSPR